MRFYDVHGLIVGSDFKLYIPEYLRIKGPVEEPDLTLRFGDAFPEGKGIQIAPEAYGLEDGSVYCELEYPGLCTLGILTKWRLLIKDLPSKCEILTNASLTSLRFMRLRLHKIMPVAMYFKLLLQDRAFLHSACLSFKDAGILLIGPPGIGKTDW